MPHHMFRQSGAMYFLVDTSGGRDLNVWGSTARVERSEARVGLRNDFSDFDSTGLHGVAGFSCKTATSLACLLSLYCWHFLEALIYNVPAVFLWLCCLLFSDRV